ncbi:MAG: TolC family protein [Lewinellaceae bacterium]|nr:TolC family protein [Saprospiraceae bacterium]MCB9337081.1 TolC family protein [Lewinellaceae bacterium]
MPIRILLATLALTSFGLAKGQTVHQLNLEQAVNLALQNAEDLKNLRLDVEIQALNNKEVTGAMYPQLSASGQGSYYTNLPQVQFPSSNFPIYQVLQDEGVKDQNGNPITTNDATTTSQALSFVAPLNVQFGISVNQLLFQPDIFIALQAKETVLQYAQDNLKVAETSIREAVQKAYYSVLIAGEQKRITEETAKRLDLLSAEMTEMYKQGFVEKLDIDKLTVTRNNTNTAINQLANAINTSKSLLKNTIGIPINDDIALTEKLEPQDLKALLLENTENFNYENRSEIALLNTARQLQEIDLRRQKYAYLPSLSAFYQFQRAGQRNPDFTLPGESPWFWYNTGLVGLSVSQPIFDGFQIKNRIGQAKLKIIKVDNSLNQLKRAIDMEQQIAKNSLNNALLNLDVQQANTDLAREVFETTKKKYEAGVGSSIELIQADTDLQRAQGAYFQALYDCYVARIALNKSLGKL